MSGDGCDSAVSPPEAVLAHIAPGADVIVPLANGEPRTLIDVLDGHARDLTRVRVHQMHTLHDHPYLHGAYGDHLRHISYFLSSVTRSAFAEGGCDLVPVNFSEMPLLLRREAKHPIVLAATSPPDPHGYVSLGTNADYTARFIGQLPFFIEVNPQMPRTFGENSLHLSQVVGWTEADYPLVEVPAPRMSAKDRQHRGVRGRPRPGWSDDSGGDRRDSQRDPRAVARPSEPRSAHGADLRWRDGPLRMGALTGTHKVTRPGKLVATFALGSRPLYDFLDDNGAVELLPSTG